MAHDLRLGNTAVNTEADAFGPLCNTGYIRIYDGTRPAGPDTAVGSQHLLAELRFAATAFGAASAGVITANAITSGTGLYAATATWYRILKSDGTTALEDGEVGGSGSGSDLELNSTSITIGATVSISNYTHTVPKS